MPFTPIHMGPGILIKGLLQGGFSLMVFGWTQIIMDIQPLVVMITGEGHLHGFSHTYIGAILLAVFSAVTGKYLTELGFKIITLGKGDAVSIIWSVAFASALIGSFSHVFLDSIMHSDVQPFYPFVLDNHLHRAISVPMLHKLCMYSGLVGAVIFYGVNLAAKKT